MSSNAPATTAKPQSPLVDAARDLVPLIRSYADQIDADRELPKPLFHALAYAGFYRMCVPRAVGGPEVDFPAYVQVIKGRGLSM